jgi:hypothetical protein
MARAKAEGRNAFQNAPGFGKEVSRKEAQEAQKFAEITFGGIWRASFRLNAPGSE